MSAPHHQTKQTPQNQPRPSASQNDELSDADLEAASVSAGASKKCNDGIGEGGKSPR